MSGEWPSVPETMLDADGWERVNRREETVFRLPTARVIGRTVVYEDADLRERLAEEVTRFFFATALEFRPSLPPGTPQLIESTVANSAKQRFADDLRERGFDDLERRDQGRMRIESGARARLTTIRASYDREAGAFDITGWLATWRADGFRLAGGAHPAAGPGLEADAADHYRDDLLALIRAVS